MDQRQALYEYLRQKSGKAQDPMQDAYKLADVGTLLGGLSESASMAGQIQGKRAESDIIPKVSQGLYKSSLDAAKSDQDLADSQYKRLLLMEKLSPENRARQEKYRFEPDLRSPEGDPVMMSEAGKYQTLPGFKVQQRPQTQLGQIVGGYEKPGYVLEKKPDGSLVERPLPPGFKPKERPNETGGAQRMSESSTMRVSEAREAFAQADNVASSMEKWKGMMGPVEGRARSWNPYDENAQMFDADLTKAAQVIGKYMEGGVLRAEDIPKYKKMLPSLSDTPKVGQYKLDQVKNMLSDKQQRDIQALQSQGYQTEGLNIQEKSGKVRVRNKQTGKTGTVSKEFLDPQKYEVIE